MGCFGFLGCGSRKEKKKIKGKKGKNLKQPATTTVVPGPDALETLVKPEAEALTLIPDDPVKLEAEARVPVPALESDPLPLVPTNIGEKKEFVAQDQDHEIRKTSMAVMVFQPLHGKLELVQYVKCM